MTGVQTCALPICGTVDLTQLPSGLQDLDLGSNAFSGTVDLTRLPSGLQYLFLDNNAFSGTVDLTQLPVGLFELDLTFNSGICGNTSSSIGCSPLYLPSQCRCTDQSFVVCPAC